MQTRLTDIVVAKTKPPAKGQLDIFDTILPCFGVRIGKRTRTYFVTYRIGGVRKRMSIGNVKRMSLGEARKLADEALALVEKEVDPQAIPKELESERVPTFREAVERFMREHTVRPKTAVNWWGVFRNDAFPFWSDRPVTAITKRDVVALVGAVKARGAPVQANRCFETVRRFFNWGVENGILNESPCEKMGRSTKEASRERFLTDDEIRRFWSAAERVGASFRDVFRLLLITAQRESEVGKMRWREVDLGSQTWTIPAERAKNGRAHEVALSGLAVEILERRERVSEFVFPSVRPHRSNAGKTAVSGYSKAKARLDAAMGDVEPWILHDLRRTVTTQLAEMGVPPQVADKVLNHKSGTIRGVAAVYNRYEYRKEARDALMKWEARLREIVESAPPGANHAPPAPAVAE